MGVAALLGHLRDGLPNTVEAPGTGLWFGSEDAAGVGGGWCNDIDLARQLKAILHVFRV